MKKFTIIAAILLGGCGADLKLGLTYTPPMTFGVTIEPAASLAGIEAAPAPEKASTRPCQ